MCLLRVDFNLDSHLTHVPDKPHNPMINAGAILTTALLKPKMQMSDRFDYVGIKSILIYSPLPHFVRYLYYFSLFSHFMYLVFYYFVIYVLLYLFFVYFYYFVIYILFCY